MPDIKHSIQITAPAERVYALGSTAAGFGEWWATDITEEGGLVSLGFFNRATIYRLRPVTATAPATMEWVCESGDEWGGTHLIFEVEALKNVVQLRFAHAGWRAETEYFRACNTTWGGLMFRLKAAAEGKGQGPLFTAAYVTA